MNQSETTWQISEAEVGALVEERQKLEQRLRRERPLRFDGLPRRRRLRGSLPTKLEIVAKSIVVGQCWIWMPAKTKSGYGRLGVSGRVANAHAIALSLWKGNKSDGQEGCHKCDNPSCVNPAHLFWGTRADNMSDCILKGRRPKTYKKAQPS